MIFILSSIFSGLEFWAANYTSVYWNSELKIFRNIKILSEILNNWPKDLFGTNVNKTFESWQYYNELILLQWFINEGFFTIFIFMYVYSVVPRNFKISGVRSLTLYFLLVLNINLFSILFTHVLIDALLVFSRSFVRYIQSNLEYLIQSMIYQIDHFFISCWNWYFKFIAFLWHCYISSMCNTY